MALTFSQELILERQLGKKESLIKVAASYEESNPTLFNECMKEAEQCQKLIDYINSKK
jgi:hypothetical protein